MKLQMLTNDGWQYVFAHKSGQVITTLDPRKALPGKGPAQWAKDDLEWFSSRFSDLKFRLA